MADIDHAARIAEIRAQLEAATPGPWCPLIDREYEEFRPGVTVTPEGVSDSHGNWLFEASGDCTVADCVLAGSAPTHIRYLLDRVAELEHQLGEPTEPDDLLTAFNELAAASGDTWDGVDPQEYVRKLREE
jgi:hypothetical protein